MNQNAVLEMMLATPLFSRTDRDMLREAVEASQLMKYEKDSEMLGEQPALCFIISGKAVVRRALAGQSVILNTLGRGSVFGAAQLFGSGEVITSVKAACRCACLCMSQKTVSDLLKKDHGFTLGYITFLSDRIRFLNRRIASFTAGGGERTVAEYLLSLPEKDGAVVLPVSMAHLASALNISRPTLYRAFASLSDRGVIRKDGNRVIIISLQKLKSI